MRLSRSFFKTLKETPKEAQIPSHLLMLRSGMIQQLSSGIYNYLPLAVRSLSKIETIIREELTRAGAEEVSLPMVQPAELWKESGRWDFYGPELLRFEDRRQGQFCLGPTHEEVITDMVKRVLNSYKQMPWNLFQIQTKFRDEIRPRFGLMRGREFIMKDGYSFDVDEEASRLSYQKMFDTYNRIFARCGLDFKAVQADSGNIGGSLSHEFQVLADTGEDQLLYCMACDFVANAEKAPLVEVARPSTNSNILESSLVETPGVTSIEDVSLFLKKDQKSLLKSLLFRVDEVLLIAIVRGDKKINQAKLQTLLNASDCQLASEEDIKQVSGAPLGFLGPVDLKEKVKIIVDSLVYEETPYIVGANIADLHRQSVVLGRDFQSDITGDISFTEEGDLCPQCCDVDKKTSSTLHSRSGIEVGHIFYLGTKYSSSMGCEFLDQNGKKQPVSMGCYGIGVGRTMAAAIEQNHDDAGIIWPFSIAPYEIIVIPLQINKEEVFNQAKIFYSELKEQKWDAVLDDRNERPGSKFNDADLIGYPLQIILGSKGLENNTAEIQIRETKKKHTVALDEVLLFVNEYREKVNNSYSQKVGPYE